MRTVAEAFNEWMRRYTETPDQFVREFQTVNQFLAEQDSGRAPSYGEACAAYLAELQAWKLEPLTSPPECETKSTEDLSLFGRWER